MSRLYILIDIITTSLKLNCECALISSSTDGADEGEYDGVVGERKFTS